MHRRIRIHIDGVPLRIVQWGDNEPPASSTSNTAWFGLLALRSTGASITGCTPTCE
jgi:hypothetical protein